MNIRLNHTITGRGPVLLLLHPVGLDNSCWGGLVNRLSQSHTSVAVDLRGHGKSPSALAPGGIADFVSDIEGLMDDLTIKAATVLGLSFGGMIAQELAIKRPDRIRRLIVGACAGSIPAEARAAVEARGTAALEGGMASVVDETLERWFTRAFISDPKIDQVRARLLSNDPAGWAEGWKAISRFDAFERLSTLNIPVQVIAGECDAATPVAATQKLAEAIEGALFTEIGGAPHMMQIECEGRFTDCVTAFLASSASQE